MKNEFTGLLVPSKTFKMPSTVKTMLASITDKTARDTFKQNMIQAVLQSEVKVEKEKKTK